MERFLIVMVTMWLTVKTTSRQSWYAYGIPHGFLVTMADRRPKNVPIGTITSDLAFGISLAQRDNELYGAFVELR